MLRLRMVFRVVVGLLLWRRSPLLLVWLSSFLSALVVTGCGGVDPSPVEPQISQEQVKELCWLPPELDPDVATKKRYFVFPHENGRAYADHQMPDFALGLAHGEFVHTYSRFAPIENLRLVPLSRPEAWCTHIPKPTNDAVLRLLDPCGEPMSDEEALALAKKVFGQTVVRSGLFCGQEPRTAPSTHQVILLRERNEAYQTAYEHARKTSMALTQAQADADWVSNKSDWDLKKFFQDDPGSLEQIQQRLADALDSIEPPPVYDDPILESIAMAGFQAGFDDGKFEVEAKLFAIDAGILILEVVAMEVALGPLGGANALAKAASKSGKALAKAVKRLENIPIFIPGAAGGLGAFVPVGKVLKKAVEGSSRALHLAMKAKGMRRPPGCATHHMVAHGHEWAEPARKALASVGIKLDEAVNGVYLPRFKTSPNPNGSIVHAILSNNKKYYDKVNNFLANPKSKKDAIRKLKRIREALENGTFFDAPL